MNRRRLQAAAALLSLLLVGVGCTTSGNGDPDNTMGQASQTRPAMSSLPRIPWEGGPAYWAQFPKTKAAGWSDPGFFPVVIWYNGISSDDEALYDKSLGFNTYIGMSENAKYDLFADNDVFWIGGKLNDTFTDQSRNWVGNFLSDEADGRFANPVDGQADMLAAKQANSGNGRFNFANFSQTIMAQDMKAADSEKFVNGYTDVVSIDMYWYTVPFCDWQPSPVAYLTPVTAKNCRTSSSYGKTMTSLRQRDATDGRLQALWQFVEVLNGGPGDDQPFVANITPDQLQGAVMNSIIHEARGVVYFNQSLNGPCTGGSLVRQSMVTKDFCATPQVRAAGVINNWIHELAPVINSQSYQYSFGPGLDTMLKTSDGYAYIFAMIDDHLNPGSRTFTLPAGISGSSVQVLHENRVISVDRGGKFSDIFDAEYSYHIYKVKL